MQITIRSATTDDAEAISAIWKVICAERVYTAVNRPFTPQQERDYIASLSSREGIFLAEVDGRIVGFMSLDLWAKYTGIGHRLAEHTLDFSHANGYEKIVIYVRASNTGAQAFYRSLGFIPKGILERQVKIDGRYEDEVFMESFLS